MQTVIIRLTHVDYANHERAIGIEFDIIKPITPTEFKD